MNQSVSKVRTTIFRKIILVVALTSLPLCQFFVILQPQLMHFGPRDSAVWSLVLGITLLVQIVRGFLSQLELPSIPKWLLLSQMDWHLYADTLLVLAASWLVVGITLPAQVDVKAIVPMSSSLLAGYIILSLATFAIYFRKSYRNNSALTLASIKWSVILLGPFASYAVVFWALYSAFHLTSARDMHLMLVSMGIAAFSASILALRKGTGDRVRNTVRNITALYLSIPVSTVVFCILRTVWPQNLDSMSLVCILFLAMWIATPVSGIIRARKLEKKILRLEEEIANIDRPNHVQQTEKLGAELMKAKKDLSSLKSTGIPVDPALAAVPPAQEIIPDKKALTGLNDIYIKLSGVKTKSIIELQLDPEAITSAIRDKLQETGLRVVEQKQLARATLEFQLVSAAVPKASANQKAIALLTMVKEFATNDRLRGRGMGLWLSVWQYQTLIVIEERVLSAVLQKQIVSSVEPFISSWKEANT